jgi:RND family efflux transporter MFP subunit
LNPTIMKTLRVGAAAAVILLAGGGAYYFYYGRPPLVKVGTATLAPVSEFVYGSGIVEPVQWAKVFPAQRRRLVQLCHCEGSTVKQGQVLGQQDDAEEKAQLREMEAAHQQLLRDLDRAIKDAKPTAEIDQRRSAVDQSSSRITAQKTRIDSLVLRAPMDGVVLRRDGEVGEIVDPSNVLFWVGTASPLQVVAEINEEDILHVAVGQTAFLTNEAFSNQPMRASVSQITPKGDPTKKSFRVYLRLPTNTPLKIGMNVEVNIVFRETPSAIVVPNEAVLDGTVQVVTDNKVKRVTVSTGVRGTRNTEIKGNLSPGVTLLVPARKDLADGKRVRFEAAATPQATPSAKPDSGSRPATQDYVDQDIANSLSTHLNNAVSDARRDAPSRY